MIPDSISLSLRVKPRFPLRVAPYHHRFKGVILHSGNSRGFIFLRVSQRVAPYRSIPRVAWNSNHYTNQRDDNQRQLYCDKSYLWHLG